MVVTQLADQLADSPKAVRAEQEQQLFDAMVEERQSFKFTTDLSDPSKLTGDVASYYTEDSKKRYLQELDQLSQRYLARAQTILSPEQLGAFQSSLASQQAMQAASVTVALKVVPDKISRELVDMRAGRTKGACPFPTSGPHRGRSAGIRLQTTCWLAPGCGKLSS